MEIIVGIAVFLSIVATWMVQGSVVLHGCGRCRHFMLRLDVATDRWAASTEIREADRSRAWSASEPGQRSVAVRMTRPDEEHQTENACIICFSTSSFLTTLRAALPFELRTYWQPGKRRRGGSSFLRARMRIR